MTVSFVGTKPGHGDRWGSVRSQSRSKRRSHGDHAGRSGYVVMSTSLVSGRKITATTKLIAAMAIGYHSPE
jgi:hypothetical protein